ncbi:hypothetical protein FJT64_013833 [Amphibalanus amphitrite]|uniref:Uncharacterized protein n=1 Tax=Amphibalanus amphitrite TaxID=1232801 RepID=A0A6A4V1K0_AMPAM|nr:hypothetical protein FJT64_013833 [Amphibalanus amphitrite]
MKNKRLNIKEESIDADEPLDLSVKKTSDEPDREFEEAFDDNDAERSLVSEFHSKLLPIKKRNLVRSQSAMPWLDLSRYPDGPGPSTSAVAADFYGSLSSGGERQSAPADALGRPGEHSKLLEMLTSEGAAAAAAAVAAAAAAPGPAGLRHPAGHPQQQGEGPWRGARARGVGKDSGTEWC